MPAKVPGLWRYWALIGLVAFGVGWVGTRLVQLHLDVIPEPRGRTFNLTTPAARGTIYDCTGCPLAASIPVWTYHIDPQAVSSRHTPEFVASNVAAALNMPYGEVLDKFTRSGRNRYVPLATSFDDAAHLALTDVKLVSGVRCEEDQVRRYPHGRSMAHVIGFVNHNKRSPVGGAGIEQSQNSILTGIPGSVTGMKDAKGNELYDRRKISTPPIDGASVHLTIDHNIQYDVEKALREQVAKLGAKAGWAVVERVKTGAVVAMANMPDFSPANYNDSDEDAWRNRAVSHSYEPGSMMKSITVAAALNAGTTDTTRLYDAYMGTWEYAGRILHDHPTGKMNIGAALAKSSNIVCAKVGLELGPERLYSYLRGFGFGSQTGIDLPGEETGILRNWKRWDKVTPSRVPIGQGVTVTGVQMANAYATIANGGVQLRPYVVERIVSSNGDEVYRHEREVTARPIRRDVARKMLMLMSNVTRKSAGGTASRAAVKGYSVAGKTGTAQKTVNGRVSDRCYYASFCGIIPATAPEFVVLVTLDEPDFSGPHTGGNAAAPVFREIATRLMRYYEIPPDLVDEIDWDERDEEGEGR